MMTTSVTTQTKILQPASENLKRPFVQWGRRWILSVLALVVLAASAAGIALVAAGGSAVAPSEASIIGQAGTANTTPVEDPVWIGDILFRLEAGKARADTCLTLVNPLPACTP